jgi:hypothetical protein
MRSQGNIDFSLVENSPQPPQPVESSKWVVLLPPSFIIFATLL